MSKIRFHLSLSGERTAELTPGKTLTIGRSAENSVQLEDASVSRRHAQITWSQRGTCLVEDLKSVNGTALNGEAVTQPRVLHDGDRLRFGGIVAVYYDADEDAEQPTAIHSVKLDTFANRYGIRSQLGETSEYNNFRAEDLEDENRTVSLRVFNPGVISDADEFARAAAEFARINASPPHPNLVRLLHFDRWRGSSYLAAEWIEGYPLLDLLRRRGALTVAEMAPLARQAAMTADHAHAHGLPAPNLDPRSALIVFERAVSAAEWEQLLDVPLARWPAFALKITPQLIEPVKSVSKAEVTPLGALVYELLGHPLSARGLSHATRVPGLGEGGNAILVRGSALTEGRTGGNLAFVEELVRAALTHS